MIRVAPFFALVLSLQACAPDSPAPPPPVEATPPAVAEKADSDCHLIMGWDPWEPYHYRDVGGDVHGLDVELVSAIAAEAGCTVGFDQEDWATLLGRLRQGEIHLLSGATRTEARESFAWFSDPYREESFGLYVRAGEADDYPGDSLAGLLDAGLTVGMTLEYVYGDEVNQLQDDPSYAGQFRGAAVGELNYDRLVNFEIDSFLEDPFVAATHIRKRGLGERIEAHPLIVATGSVRLMFSKEAVSQETVQRFNDAMAKLRASGEFQRIIARYL